MASNLADKVVKRYREDRMLPYSLQPWYAAIGTGFHGRDIVCAHCLEDFLEESHKTADRLKWADLATMDDDIPCDRCGGSIVAPGHDFPYED